MDSDGHFDASVESEIDALEHEAAALIRAHTDRTLLPIQRRLDAALVVAHRLLKRPPPEGVTIQYDEALDYLRSLEPSLVGCPAVGVGGFHSDSYADPDDGVCQWCGGVAPSRATPPEGA